jgi:D-aminopeptidase
MSFKPGERCRLRDLGIQLGRFKPGRYNAITDVGRILVGHSTINRDTPQGPARTGVTAIMPNDRNVFMDRVMGGGFVLNGAGELSGLHQVLEWGVIETPIILTNTMSVGTCGEAVVNYMMEKYPEIGGRQDVIIPLVGECDDSWLNDVSGRHVKAEHVYEAISNARSGPVMEGNVGAGTGMITCDFKGGIGTSSRRLHTSQGGFSVGVLVMSNFGVMEDLRVDGAPLGRELARRFEQENRRVNNYGSIIAVVATNAPLLPHQLTRLAKRVALGIGRVGSYAAHNSGEIILAFSTSNNVPREGDRRVFRMKVLMDHNMNHLYPAAIEATEEAILNALCAATEMRGLKDRYCPALPLEEVKRLAEFRLKVWPTLRPQ